jgi:hypothetical protein
VQTERLAIASPVHVLSAPGPRRPAAGFAHRAVNGLADASLLLGVILFIPFVILAIGLPVALVLRLVLWVGRSFS